MKKALIIRVTLALAIVCLLQISGCNKPESIVSLDVSVMNELNFKRKEVVAVNYGQLADLLENNAEKTLRIMAGNVCLPIQWIDNDGDGKNDALLFQAEADAKSTVVYKIIADSTIALPELKNVAFSRFVPERSDDYAWENDKVAFRVYGPAGQQEALDSVPGSTLSSGIDLWLKRVEYPVIDDWYSNHTTSPGYYHKDRGEGYDPYHVGASRGTGGIGIWENDSLFVSQNFTAYRTIANGPLRTVFELDYAPWSPYAVHETKRITLDVGTNFSKFEVTLKSEKRVPNFAVGISLHENKGTTKLNPAEGWFRHWELIDSSYVGEGIVLHPKMVKDSIIRKSAVKDQSNLLVVVNPTDILTYYAGFAWDKSNQVANSNDWDDLLAKQAKIIASPLVVNVKTAKEK